MKHKTDAQYNIHVYAILMDTPQSLYDVFVKLFLQYTLASS